MRKDAETVPRRLPTNVLAELCIGFALGIYWQVDLRSPFLPLLSATDASTQHGFGASVMKAGTALIRRLASISEKQGDYIVLDGGIVTGPSARRLGEANELNISTNDFTDIFSIRHKFPGHINVLEGEAFISWLRRILRSRRRHSTKLVMLVDSSVLRKAAALELAGDLQYTLC